MIPPAKPPQQDPACAEFWDSRFKSGATPWDAGRVPEAFRAFVDGYRGGRRVLVPGCGSGWEASLLAHAGFEVVAIDFAPAAVERARANLGEHAPCARQADFFAFDAGAPFDLVYERTFLCALPRRLWPAYAQRMAALVRPCGVLAGYFFFRDDPKGPPFGTSPDALEALLGPWFAREEDREVVDSIELFRGMERWQVWRRSA